MLVAVSQCDKSHADLAEVPESVVGYIPSEHVVSYLIVLMTFALPLLWCPFAEWRQSESHLIDKLFHLAYDAVYFRSLHYFINPRFRCSIPYVYYPARSAPSADSALS